MRRRIGYRIPALLAPVLLTGAVQAENCPAAPDHSDGLSQLIARAQQAETENEAREISNRMWELWADAPNEQAQAILDRGMGKRAGWDLLGALQDFDTLVNYCPNYAEGYNQRAFVNFLRHDFATALEDLDRALELSPRHIAAMSGRALSLLALDRIEEARSTFAEALELNPWLPERSLAAPGGPLSIPGKDI